MRKMIEMKTATIIKSMKMMTINKSLPLFQLPFPETELDLMESEGCAGD